MAELVNSKRHRYTASYVTKQMNPSEKQAEEESPGGGLLKAHLVRALGLDSDQLERVRRAAEAAHDPHLKRAADAAAAVAAAPSPETLTRLAAVRGSDLLKLGDIISEQLGLDDTSSLMIDLFARGSHILPVGWLFLERIETYPVGVERGEMVFTVPMAPKETITISHKEWSTSSDEYTQIIDDYFEGYSERGVIDKTDASTSTENEARRASSINFGATLSGGYGPVTLTTMFGLNSSAEERTSVKQSMQRNREVTEKASARTRKQHKVSVKLESKKGVEDSSFRTITNESADAVRIDFYRMMRKWRNDLYRYDLRMTYDITIPTPGARIWARWRRLAELDEKIGSPFVFNRPGSPEPIKPGDITDASFSELNWATLANRYGASVGPPPPAVMELPPLAKVVSTGQRSQEIFEFAAPPGYTLETTVRGQIIYWGGGTGPLLDITDPDWVATRIKHPGTGPGDGWYEVRLDAFGTPEKRTVMLIVGDGASLAVVLAIKAHRTTEAFRQWQHTTWKTIRDAAQRQHADAVARLQEERDDLWRSLAGKDTLSLRRLEREELLRQILLWIVGPVTGYTNAPAAVEHALQEILANEIDLIDGEPYPPSTSPTFKGIDQKDWSRSLLFGELVTFVQQAVEWENLLYFMYPYFWGSEQQGRDRLLFEHPDPEHERFLRAGYARIVVTVRPGFERDFLAFVETGSLAGQPSAAKLTIAQQIQAFARTNYGGIPPANPETHARPLLYPQQRHTWDTMQTVIAAIEKYFTGNGHYPAALTDLPGGTTPKDAWGNDLVYVIPGSGNEYDLFSYGANGTPGGEGLDADISAAAGASLVASWFDYTPTSGIDIEIGTPPADIA